MWRSPQNCHSTVPFAHRHIDNRLETSSHIFWSTVAWPDYVLVLDTPVLALTIFVGKLDKAECSGTHIRSLTRNRWTHISIQSVTDHMTCYDMHPATQPATFLHGLTVLRCSMSKGCSKCTESDQTKATCGTQRWPNKCQHCLQACWASLRVPGGRSRRSAGQKPRPVPADCGGPMALPSWEMPIVPVRNHP